MSQLDLLILVFYTITVILVVTRAIESLDKKTTIAFNETRFNEKLTQYELGDKLKIKFRFEKRYDLNAQPTQLSITIENKAEDAIYIDWDQSSISDLGGRSRRIIRLTPYGSPDLSKAQVYTVVPPSGSVQEAITAESCLTHDESNPELLKPTKQLLDIGAIQKAGFKSKDQRKLYKNFIDEKVTLEYPVWIVFQMRASGTANRGDRLYAVPCDIVTKKVPWTDSLPWK